MSSHETVVIIPLVVIGALVALFYGWRVVAAARSSRWPRVTGRVVKARIVPKSVASALGVHRQMYNAEVEYSYEVRGKRYVGSRYWHGDATWRSYSKALSALRGITVGSPIPVYYKPSNPQRAVLMRGMHFFGR